jgi:hypothetical protein
LRPKIQNDRDVEVLLAEIEASQKSKSNRSNVPYWITFVLAIGLLSSVVGVSLQQGDFSNISRSSFFPDLESLFGKTATDQKTALAVPPVEVTLVMDVPVPEISVTTENTTVTPEVAAPAPVLEPAPAATVALVPKAYIVVGAFFDQQYAEKAKMEAAENGFQTVQLDEYDGALHRVMIVTDIQNVQADLAMVKSTMNARAWVYCTSCSH